MAHEKTSKIRADLRMALHDGVRVMHVRYLQENQTEFLTPRHQKKALKDQLADLCNTIKSSQSALTMQVRRKVDDKKRESCNAYCAARDIKRTLKRNLGRSVKASYEKLLAEVKKKFPNVLTDKGQGEFDPEYTHRRIRCTRQKKTSKFASKPVATSPIT